MRRGEQCQRGIRGDLWRDVEWEPAIDLQEEEHCEARDETREWHSDEPRDDHACERAPRDVLARSKATHRHHTTHLSAANNTPYTKLKDTWTESESECKSKCKYEVSNLAMCAGDGQAEVWGDEHHDGSPELDHERRRRRNYRELLADCGHHAAAPHRHTNRDADAAECQDPNWRRRLRRLRPSRRQQPDSNQRADRVTAYNKTQYTCFCAM